ncbi:hypothetical protein [Variovorax saccharolyticus]|uniref:hypothetical protein n=1 Tax=Variovorax saccharolyticus TaxID=3053516 RepID=UPI002575925F|nr:hypothetical protein [Variovorax sp. J31P216]MDM0025313.1 hypothetical protein [Variovorax sp. J31P216]
MGASASPRSNTGGTQEPPSPVCSRAPGLPRATSPSMQAEQRAESLTGSSSV